MSTVGMDQQSVIEAEKERFEPGATEIGDGMTAEYAERLEKAVWTLWHVLRSKHDDATDDHDDMDEMVKDSGSVLSTDVGSMSEGSTGQLCGSPQGSDVCTKDAFLWPCPRAPEQPQTEAGSTRLAVSVAGRKRTVSICWTAALTMGILAAVAKARSVSSACS